MGFAITVRCVPSDTRVGRGPFPTRAGLKELKSAQYRRAPDPWKEVARPGDVVVMDTSGVFKAGNIGSNNSLAWAKKGIVGVVTNGGARDTDEIIKVNRLSG